MKCIIVLSVLAAVCVAMPQNDEMTAALQTQTAATVKAILEDETKMTAYLKCVVNEGPCDESANRLKAITINMLSDECSKCDDRQKAILSTIAAFLAAKRPNDWEKIKDLYDPKKAHRTFIDAAVKAGQAARPAA